MKTGYPPEDILEEADIAAAKWAWEHNRPAGRGADTLPGAKRLFLPMRTGRGAIGVIGIDSDKPGPLLTPGAAPAFDALSDQAALAIERVHLVEDIERAKLAAEADRLRQALLTSISHDLKTPLAAIFGAAGTLRDFSRALDDRAKTELLGTIIDESERLNRFIANLLDMIRLESGAVVPDRCSSRPRRNRRDRARAREQDSRRASGRGRARARPADGAVDAVLFEQVLFNLLDNAAKYAPPGTMIRIQGCRATDQFAFRSWTRDRVSLLRIWSAYSINSIGHRRAIGCVREPGLVWRSREASSRPWGAPSRPETDRTAPEPYSPSPAGDGGR